MSDDDPLHLIDEVVQTSCLRGDVIVQTLGNPMIPILESYGMDDVPFADHVSTLARCRFMDNPKALGESILNSSYHMLTLPHLRLSCCVLGGPFPRRGRRCTKPQVRGNLKRTSPEGATVT